MPRPQIEFIQAQALAWTDDVHWLGRGVLQKQLSLDPLSGASTTILRYAPGFHRDEDFSLACDEEFYVLDGSLFIGDDEYVAGDYAYLPTAYPRAGIRSDGCDVLSFIEGASALCETEGDYDDAGLIKCLATSAMPWGSASDARVASASVGRKLLRPDTASGERTWILSLRVNDGQRYPLNGVEKHPCVEEMFLLEGDIAMETGTLRQGAYFWRPPHIKHGPMGTTTGFVALFRAKEGRFTTEWSEPTIDIPWSAAYSPVIPEDVRYRMQAAPDLTSPY